jgi:Coenzyme PQQ synthesis protein D (PqqD)
MKKRVENQLPRARQEHLVIQDLPDELLIYDLERHRAYCLNRIAALVWQSCDGRRTVGEMTQALEKKIAHPVNEHLIWFALDQLNRCRLLEEQIELPILRERMTRRELARRLGFATAALVPFITSIVAPTAAQTATCRAVGVICTTNAHCCSNLCVNGTCVCIANQSTCDPNQPQQCCSGRCGSANNKCLP